MGLVVAANAHIIPSEMPLWTPGGRHPTEPAPGVPAAAYGMSTAEGGASFRGTQLGVQEPLSFYGNVHAADPMPVAEVPMWIWASSTVICVLLLLLWALHQRRFSLVAGQLRLIQRRCFSPPAALYMSLVYSFFPLSGAIAWLSLLEPRVGLLLSQLRSAWEVCCMHCFMLLMLHLMGGPETTLLLIQQQHSLRLTQNSNETHVDAKQVFISTGVDWGVRQDKKKLPPSLQPEQTGTHQKADVHGAGSKFESGLITVRHVSQSGSSSNGSKNNSISNSSSSNSDTNRLTEVQLSELNATRFYRRSISTPNILFSAEALPTAASRIPAAPETAPAVKGEQELDPDGIGQGACRVSACSCSDSASSASQAENEEVAPQEEGKGTSETPKNAAAPATAFPVAVDAADYGVTCKIALGPLKNPREPKCRCSVASAADNQWRIRWKRARRASCLSSKSCLHCNKAVNCSRSSGDNRHSGSQGALQTSRSYKNSSSNSSNSPTASADGQGTCSIWRRCRERLHRQRLTLRASKHRRKSMPHFTPAVVVVTPRSGESGRSPYEGDALLPVFHATAASAAAVALAASAAAAGEVLELHLQHQRQSLRMPEATGARRSDKNIDPPGREAATITIDTADAAIRARTNRREQVVSSPSLAPLAAVDVHQQLLKHHKLQHQGPLQQQQKGRVLRLRAAETGASRSGAAVPCSTCSTAVASHGSSPAGLFAGNDQRTGAASKDIHRKGESFDIQSQPRPTSATNDASPHEKRGNGAGAADRRIWFVPPLCCLAWKTKARPFSAWDLRMSYRCLLPFTVLKLLRVLLCYLLSTLMHLGNEREKDAAAAGFRDASVAGGGEASHQHVLQRLLQLCCFFSLVVAMWGLAVVFVATRPLLKPFNIGWKFTCLKALVFFIQLLELAAEALQPISRAAISATDDAAAATTAAAQIVYVFTFLELLGSAVCAVMATWAYKPGDLLRAHQRLLLLQKQLPVGAAPAIEENGSYSTNCEKWRHASMPFSKLVAVARRCSFRRFRPSPA